MNTQTELSLDVRFKPLTSPDPAMGPRIVFFSGGTALNAVAPELARLTDNVSYLVTPFDNGGSSKKLRAALAMPAVGDLRARIVAMAGGASASPLAAALAYRLPAEADPGQLQRELAELFSGRHARITDLTSADRGYVLTHLRHTIHALPKWFDYRRASVGNLVITGGYLLQGRRMEPVVHHILQRLGCRGHVSLSAADTLQLAAEMPDGRRIVGQDRITGKEAQPLSQAPARVYLCDADGPRSANLPVENHRRIAAADLICFPPGSLFSSVIANLLPKGTGRAIAESDAHKIYVPSLGHDPECPDLSLVDQVGAILKVLREDAGPDAFIADLLSEVVVDLRVSPEDCAEVEAAFAIPCTRHALTKAHHGHYDATALSQVLVRLA